MDIRMVFAYTSIIVGVGLLLSISLFVVSSRTAGCAEGASMDNATQNCYYMTGTGVCNQDETLGAINGQRVCMYAPVGFMSTGLFKGIIVLLLGVNGLVLVVFLAHRFKTASPVEVTEFKKKDFIFPNVAKDLWALQWSKRYGIPTTDNHYKKTAFNFMHASDPFPLGNEWFAKWQVEVLEGTNTGVFTVHVSLSRGREWVLNDMARWHEDTYENYKIPRNMPLRVPPNVYERIMESLYEKYPERAVEAQEQMLAGELKRSVAPSRTQFQQPPSVLGSTGYAGGQGSLDQTETGTVAPAPEPRQQYSSYRPQSYRRSYPTRRWLR